MLGGLLSSTKLQCRVVGALILRELTTRFGRENIGFLWFIGEPIIFCLGVTIVWTLIRDRHEHGVSTTAFVMTGYVPLTMWRHCVGRSMKAFESNGALMFHKQVTPLDIITARSILEIMGTLCAGIIVIAGAICIGVADPPADWGLMCLGTIYQAAFSYASALIIAALSERSEMLEKVLGVAMYLSIPFSGAFVMVDWLPDKFQQVVLWSPMVHNLEMIRGGQFGHTVHPVFSVYYDTWITALLLLIGFNLTLRVRQYITVQ